ncbi:hypothetical protein I5L51_04775 [Pseudomonas mendocina]|nr:hypothetical protein [Pseudomonas mendocina]MBH3338421.1 hypothetical protein [Pseudomonas mendocina]
MSAKQNSSEIEIKRSRIGSISVYEISDGELEALERGTPATALTNISFFCASSFLSFLIVVTTSPNLELKLYMVYFSVGLVSLAVTLVCGVVAYKMGGGIKQITSKIRGRIPASEVEKKYDGEVEKSDDDPESHEPE